jgi:hypothetical protein
MSDVMTYIVCYPELPAGSTIDIGEWPVQAVGLPAFLPALVMRLSKKVCFEEQFYRPLWPGCLHISAVRE